MTSTSSGALPELGLLLALAAPTTEALSPLLSCRLSRRPRPLRSRSAFSPFSALSPLSRLDILDALLSVRPLPRRRSSFWELHQSSQHTWPLEHRRLKMWTRLSEPDGAEFKVIALQCVKNPMLPMTRSTQVLKFPFPSDLVKI